VGPQVLVAEAVVAGVRVRRFLQQASLLAVLGSALALRALRLGSAELRGDEAFGYFFSLRSFADIVRATLDLQEPHPVASYFVQKVWLAWAGDSEFALRFVSVCSGVLAVALLYRLGRQIGLSQAMAIPAAGLLALSPYAIWHSQDARMYTMSLALTMASTSIALEWMRRWHWSNALAYLLVSWLALHTHYYAAFVLLAQNAFVLGQVLLQGGRGRRWRSWFAIQALLALGYAPWLWQAGHVLSGYEGTGESPGLIQMVCRSLSAFAVGETVPMGQRSSFALLAALLMLLGVIRLARGDSQQQQGLGLLLLSSYPTGYDLACGDPAAHFQRALFGHRLSAFFPAACGWPFSPHACGSPAKLLCLCAEDSLLAGGLDILAGCVAGCVVGQHVDVPPAPLHGARL